jgi:hypothetical protein
MKYFMDSWRVNYPNSKFQIPIFITANMTVAWIRKVEVDDAAINDSLRMR